MSGRVKQRTKGNTKPSSSGRAAEMLSRDGLMGFVGFGEAGSSTDGSSLQFVPATAENAESSVHSDFLVVMKKLSKRDAITKLKAVQEFGELCKTSDIKAVLGVLKYWPRLYNKLALDIDYPVREATQHAMNQMASRVGRNFAPHLKSVMGVWLCSQCDPYLPVATAAQKAFNAAFAENKQREVLGFCKKEINERLVDNLLNQTADTLSDPDVVVEKDRAAKYVRVMASSLQALGKFLKMADDDATSQIFHYHTRLTSEKKFWKLGRHKSPQIRAAFFSLLSIYCQKLPSLIESSSGSVCPIVLGSLDEADAIVSSPLWEAVLQLVTSLKGYWKHVNMEKAVLPKFWHFLSNAAYGNAHVVMMSVMPFVSTLPEEVVSPSSGFGQKLLEKIVDGLKLVKTQQSPSECKAVLSSFMDCVNYFLLFCARHWQIEILEKDVEQLTSDVISMLIKVLDMFFAPKTQMRLSSSLLYDRLAQLLQDTSENADIQYRFWKVFDELIQDKTHRSENAALTCQSIVNLLSCLKSKQSLQESQPSKVRFQEPSNDDHQCTNAKSKTETKPAEVDVNLLYGGRLLATVSKTVCSRLKLVWFENSETDLILVTQLVKEFFSISLLNDILTTLRSRSEKDDQAVTDTSGDALNLGVCFCCIEEFILPVLEKIPPKPNVKCLSYVIQLLFVLLIEVKQNEQKLVFKRIFQINSSSELLYIIVNEIFEAKHYLYLSYLHGIQIGAKFVEVLRTSFSVGSEESGERYFWKTLDLCFSHPNLLEFFFNENAMGEVFNVFHHVLSQGSHFSSNVISVVQLVEKYAQNSEITFSQCDALLNDVFVDIVQLKLGGQEQLHVSQCWQSLINAAMSDQSWFDTVISQTAQQIKDFLSSANPITIEKFSVFTDAAVEMINSLSEQNNEHFRKFLMKLSPADYDWDEFRSDTLSQSTWAVTPFIDGSLSFTMFPRTESVNDLERLTTHQMFCLLLSHVLKQRCPAVFLSENDDVEHYEWRMLTEMLWLREGTTVTKGGRSIQALLTILEANLQPLLDAMNEMSGSPLLMRLLAMSVSEGGLWSLTLKSVLTGTDMDESISHVVVDLFTCEEKEYTEQRLQTLQCLLGAETSIYNIKFIVENYSKMLRMTNQSNVTGLMFRHCILSSALERWIYLSQNSDIATLEFQVTLLEVLKDIKLRQATMTDLLLFSCSLDSVAISLISLNMAIIRIMKLAVMHFPENIDDEQWDMILCSMLDWLQSCQESNIANIHVSAMTNHVCQLIEAVARTLMNTTDEKLASAETGADVSSSNDVTGKTLFKKLAEEWREFFSVSVCANLLQLWQQIAGTDMSRDEQLFVCHRRLSETLSAACCCLTTANLKQYITSSTPEETAHSISWEAGFAGKFLPYLESTFCAFQLAAYRLLVKVIPSLEFPKEGEGQLSGKDEHDDPCKSPPSELMGSILRSQIKLFSILSEAEVPFGETLGMENDHEASHITRTYLLSWKLLLVHFSNSSEELRAEYANYLRRDKYLNELLGILFRILPKRPSDTQSVAEESSLEEKYLLAEEFVHNLAFETYHDLLKTLPALVRQWWNNLEKKHALVVDKYTTSYISPLLCDKEMQTTQKATSTYDNMDIVTRSSTHEVIAYYKIEDISIELIVSLASNHPLGVINVTSGKRVGVKLNQWRLWMMQLTTFLMHQNGTILDGLLLWKRNVDKKFEGVDDCMICFSVIHGSNFSLPRLSCKTCKKKFHSACLYRWFSTSNNSTCPLCRNLF